MFQLSKRYHINPLILFVFFLTLLLAASTAFGFIVQQVSFFRTFDATLYEGMQQIYHPLLLNTIISPFNFSFLPWVHPQFLSFLIVIVGVALVWIGVRRRKDLPWAIFACVLALLLYAGLTHLSTILIFRQRPFLSLPNTLPEAFTSVWSAWPSYPSGHTTTTAVFMTVLAAFIPKMKKWFFAFAVFIGFTRVYLGAHYPSDIFAGLIIGYLIGQMTLSVVEEVRMILANRKKSA